MDGVSEVSVEEHAIVVLAKDGSRQLPAIIERLSAGGVEIDSIEVARPDLEAVFLHLTGKALRE